MAEPAAAPPAVRPEAAAALTVGAVVVSYRAADHVVACVSSLRAAGVDDVVVVDNASGDDVQARLAAAHPDATFVQTGANLGFGGGANHGIRRLRTDAVLVCNPDVTIDPALPQVLAEALAEDPRLAIVGPRIENPDGTLYPSARTFPALVDAVGHAFLGFVAPRNRFTRRYRMLDWDHAGARTVDWVSGACFVARRDALAELGGFDESYFMYLEDVDLCWRAWRAGWRVAYEPRARAVHEQGVSTDQAPYRMIAAHHRSLLRYASRTARGAERALLPAMAVGVVVRTLLAWAQRATEGRWRTHRV